MKRSLHDILVLHLLDCGEWTPSYSLEKLNTKHGYVGTSGLRRMRELAEAGKHKIAGIEYAIESKKEGRYVMYRIAGQKDTRPRFRTEIRDGYPVAVMY